MADNAGDRELVLGTKQLLAIFFVGALLCGVFFAVGYVVGGNSAKSGTSVGSDGTPTTASEGKREEPQSASDSSAASNPASSPASSPSDVGGQIPAVEPHMADNPAAAGSAPSMTNAAAPPAPTPVTKTAPPASAPAATGISVSVPEKGATYVQVTAITRPRADDLVKSFREAKLPAILAESSKAELFRVLVGPYRTPLAVHDGKQKLTELGFNALIVVKP